MYSKKAIWHIYRIVAPFFSCTKQGGLDVTTVGRVLGDVENDPMRALVALYRLGGLSGMQLMPYIPALLNNLLPVLIKIGMYVCG